MALRFKAWKQGGKSTPKENSAAPLGLARDRFDFLRFPTRNKPRSQKTPHAEPESPALVFAGPQDMQCCSSSSSGSSTCEDSETGKLASLHATDAAAESSQSSLSCPVLMKLDTEESSAESENDVDDGDDSPPRGDWACRELPRPSTAAPPNLPSRHRRLSMDMGAAPSRSVKRGTPRGSGRCSFDSGVVATTHAKTPHSQVQPSLGCTATASAHTPRRGSSRRTSLDREDKEAALYYGLDKGHGGTDSKGSGPHALRRSSSKVPSDSSSGARFYYPGLPRGPDAQRAPFSPVQLGNDLGYAAQGSPCMLVSPGFSSSFAVDSWEIGAAEQMKTSGLRNHYGGNENDGEPATFRYGGLQGGSLTQGGTATFCYSGQLRKERNMQSNVAWQAEANVPLPPAGLLPVSRRMSVDLPLDVETEDYETSEMSDAAEFLSTAHRPVVPVARSIRRLSLDLPVPLSV